jgi:hypothetical protein
MSVPSQLPTIKETSTLSSPQLPLKKTYSIAAHDLVNGKSISINIALITTSQDTRKKIFLRETKKIDQPSKFPLKKRNIGPATVIPQGEIKEPQSPKENKSCCTIM